MSAKENPAVVLQFCILSSGLKSSSFSTAVCNERKKKKNLHYCHLHTLSLNKLLYN